MRRIMLSIRCRMDRVGILLSALCALHCLLSIFLISLIGIGSQALLSPAIHEIGLLLAIAIGVITLGIGVVRHGNPVPIGIGALGIGLMAMAVAVGHGLDEALLTIAGVGLVALAHIRNLRHAG